MFSVTDLFSGCGGFSYGFKEKGFKIKYAIDIDLEFLQTFKKIFLNVKLLELIYLMNYF